jgi:hypothetical protein
VTPEEVGLLDALARLQLACCRLGWSLRVRTDRERVGLVVDLAGLTDVVRIEERVLGDEPPR